MYAALNFTEKEEIVRFASEKGIRILNLCHIPEDGKLKTLSFAATDGKRIREILEFGERVDGSSLFSFLEAGKSDIYLMPKLGRAFMNPFSRIPTLNVMCEYLDENGNPLGVAPKSVLKRAEERLRSSTSIILKALTELEFYILVKPKPEMLFVGEPDRNYHEAAPFSRFEDVRNEILVTLANIGIATKYGHSEVGRIVNKGDVYTEQHEVELALQSLSDMADTVAVAKWVIRNVCAKHEVSVSFSPKIALEHAGNGLHIHFCGLRNKQNIVADPDGTLSLDARKIIGGLLKFASSLSAFGNTTPVSYLRFIARKESPMHICWSHRDRLALIRIPLWWSFRKASDQTESRETLEYRAPDAFADMNLLFAGIALAADYGFQNPEEALRISEELCVEKNTDERRSIEVLPRSCNEAAERLEKQRKLYEANGVFPRIMIDKTVAALRAFNDRDLWKDLADKPELVENLLTQYLHQG